MNSTDNDFAVELAPWNVRVCEQVRPVRESVFVREQNVPLELEWDGLDEQCVHAIAVASDGTVIGTARMLPDGHIGRMAVVPGWRRRGVGSALLRALLAEAWRRGIAKPYLHAQVHAVGFYEGHGFHAVGDVFMDAGIPHLEMVTTRKPDRS